jgi:hypothetical protein
MSRFVKRVLIIWLAMTTITGGVAFAARREPLSNFARLFMTNPNGSLCKPPCLFGIRPGITTYRNGIARMHAHPIARYFVPPMKPLMPSWSGRNFSFVIGTYNGEEEPSSRITSLYMEFSSGSGQPDAKVDSLVLTAGDVLHYLGAPASIAVRGDIARLYYPGVRLVITVALSSRGINDLDSTDPDPVLVVHLR